MSLPHELTELKAQIEAIQQTFGSLQGYFNAIQAAQAGSVAKAGDTMTGNLLLPGLSFDNGANVLGHFETGAWTPVLIRNDGTVAASGAILFATYVKIDRLVFIKCYMTSISDGASDGSSYWRINGLPFAGTQYTGAMFAYNSLPASGFYVGDAGGNLILTNGASSYSGALGTNKAFMLGLVYETNA